MFNGNQREPKQLLLIEDDGYCYFFLTEVLKLELTQVTVVESGITGYQVASENDFDVIMINLDAPSQKGLSPIHMLREATRQTPIIVVSDREDLDFALEVVRVGAFDYLTKPFNNVARVEKAVRNAFSERDSLRQSTDIAEAERERLGLLGRSKKLDELWKTICQIAPLNVNVLVCGESGTGKELIARAIHALSGRKQESFFAMNCGALPEGLVESIMFGHEKGAFTSADKTRSGYVEKAQGGTLFLDEVSELSAKAQVALLRFLQNHEFTRVGGSSSMTSDARIIASTNRNLEGEVAKNRFRSDLFFRLNVIHLNAPPLRGRPEDILYLASHFRQRFCLKNSLPQPQFSPDAASLLEKYDWPGNVRELENLVEGMMATLAVNRQAITAKDILDYSESIRKSQESKGQTNLDSLVTQDYRHAMGGFEKTYLTALLRRYNGNVTKAAKHAGIHPVTFHRKLKKGKGYERRGRSSEATVNS